MNFCFVINNLLSASSQPGKTRRIKYYMDLYEENNIKVLLSLYKPIETPEGYERKFKIYHFKWVDIIKNNSIDGLDHIVDVILGHLSQKEAVNVNCEGGINESSIVLVATIMKYKSVPYEVAFKKVSDHRYAMKDQETVSLFKSYENFLKINNFIEEDEDKVEDSDKENKEYKTVLT